MRAGQSANELVQAAALLLSMDRAASLYLLALDDALEAGVLAEVRRRVQGLRKGVVDGSAAQLLLAPSSGVLSPPGIADDEDGLAPIVQCPPAPIGI